MSPTPGHVHLADRPGRPTAGRRPTRRSPRATASPLEPDRPLRPQHLARPAGARRAAAGRRPVRDAAVRVPADRLPAAGRGRGRRATASTTDEILVGAGADEILDIVAKAFLPAGGRAVVPTPTYAMYRVLTEQRGATRRRRPARGPRRTAGRSTCRPSAARPATRRLVWLCSPNNPTGPGRARRRDRDAPRRARRRTRPRPVARRPIVVARRGLRRVRRDDRSSGCARRYPNLIVVRTASKAYALAGLRVGFAVARPADDRPDRTRTGRPARSRPCP